MTFDPVLGHLVGDYILQNDDLAAGKKRSGRICAAHCAIWTLSVCLFAGWWSWRCWPAWLFLFAAHDAQDRGDLVQRWTRMMGQEGFRTGPCAPWSGIVIDNVLHLLQIGAVAAWLGA